MKSKTVNIQIPEDIHFADLRLQPSPDGGLRFDMWPILAIAKESAIDEHELIDDESNLWSFIVSWYLAARENGEKADPVADELLFDFMAKHYGNGFSHAPGRA